MSLESIQIIGQSDDKFQLHQSNESIKHRIIVQVGKCFDNSDARARIMGTNYDIVRSVRVYDRGLNKIAYRYDTHVYVSKYKIRVGPRAYNTFRSTVKAVTGSRASIGLPPARCIKQDLIKRPQSAIHNKSTTNRSNGDWALLYARW